MLPHKIAVENVAIIGPTELMANRPNISVPILRPELEKCSHCTFFMGRRKVLVVLGPTPNLDEGGAIFLQCHRLCFRWILYIKQKE